MSFVDSIYLIILGFFIIYGLFNGFVYEFVSLISWLFGYYMAVNYYKNFSMMYEFADISGAMKDVISMVIIFFGIQLLAWPLKRILHYLVGIFAGQLNTLLGGFAGFAKGYVASLALSIIIPLTPWAKHPEVLKSKTNKYFVEVARDLGGEKYIKELNKEVSRYIKNFNL